MSRALYKLQERLGMSYGRVLWAYLLQKHNVMPTDEVPEAMWNEINK